MAARLRSQPRLRPLDVLDTAGAVQPHRRGFRIPGVFYARVRLTKEALQQRLAPAPLLQSRGPDERVAPDQTYFRKYRDLDGLGPSYGAHIAKLHANDLNDLVGEIFDGIKLTPELRHDLRATVEFMFGKEWVHLSRAA